MIDFSIRPRLGLHVIDEKIPNYRPINQRYLPLRNQNIERHKRYYPEPAEFDEQHDDNKTRRRIYGHIDGRKSRHAHRRYGRKSASIYGTGMPDEYAKGSDNNKDPVSEIRIKYENIWTLSDDNFMRMEHYNREETLCKAIRWGSPPLAAAVRVRLRALTSFRYPARAVY